jgi:hypothetical protein
MKPTRTCRTCAESLPPDAFADYRARSCERCRTTPKTRACHCCLRTKLVDEFPYLRKKRKKPPAYRRRSPICEECHEERRRKRHRERDRKRRARRTFVDPETGRTVRRCADCKKIKDL